MSASSPSPPAAVSIKHEPEPELTEPEALNDVPSPTNDTFEPTNYYNSDAFNGKGHDHGEDSCITDDDPGLDRKSIITLPAASRSGLRDEACRTIGAGRAAGKSLAAGRVHPLNDDSFRTDQEGLLSSPSPIRQPMKIFERANKRPKREPDRAADQQGMLKNLERIERLLTLSQTDDECEIFGKHVAAELRSIENTQVRKFAKLRIQQILYETQFQLTPMFAGPLDLSMSTVAVSVPAGGSTYTMPCRSYSPSETSSPSIT